MEEQTIDLIYNITGTVGVALILLAYGLIQVNKLTSAHFLYSFINFVGASLLLVSLTRFWNLPSVIIEICWIAISVYGMGKWVQNRNKKQETGNRK